MSSPKFHVSRVYRAGGIVLIHCFLGIRGYSLIYFTSGSGISVINLGNGLVAQRSPLIRGEIREGFGTIARAVELKEFPRVRLHAVDRPVEIGLIFKVFLGFITLLIRNEASVMSSL